MATDDIESLDHLIARKFPWLFSELGFCVTSLDRFSGAFGDSVLTLHSNRLLVRFILERGRMFAEVASPSEPDRWWVLEYVCQAISGDLPIHEIPELDGLATLLLESYPS